jgi:hypothetical protein
MRFGAGRLSSLSDSLACVAQILRLRVRWRTDDCPCLSSIAPERMATTAGINDGRRAGKGRRCYDLPLGDTK